MRKFLKILLLGIIMGLGYMGIEGLYHIPSGGYANIIMAPIGGLCGVLIGSINEFDKFKNMKIWQQSLIGTIITVIIEAISGYIVNIVFDLHIWDYSELPFNWKGQICLSFSILWYMLMPFVIYLDDKIRNKLWGESCNYTIKKVYTDWLLFK